MAIFENHSFDPTAFMSGQMLSKIWLCEELEKVVDTKCVIWILGGWYATTNFLLRTRGKLPIQRVLSFDADPEATQGAKILNEASMFLGEFNAITKDVNAITYPSYGGTPDIVINTSCEHIDDDTWFERIPDGTMVVLQSNNMPHEDHSSNLNSVDELLDRYPLSDVIFSGEKFFDYTEWSFSRYMAIGTK